RRLGEVRGMPALSPARRRFPGRPGARLSDDALRAMPGLRRAHHGVERPRALPAPVSRLQRQRVRGEGRARAAGHLPAAERAATAGRWSADPAHAADAVVRPVGERVARPSGQRHPDVSPPVLTSRAYVPHGSAYPPAGAFRPIADRAPLVHNETLVERIQLYGYDSDAVLHAADFPTIS